MPRNCGIMFMVHDEKRFRNIFEMHIKKFISKFMVHENFLPRKNSVQHSLL